MLSRVRARLTYSNVVATLALFAALGGSAYAGGLIGSKDIKNRSIKRVDIRKNHLTGKEIAESRLRRVPSAREAQDAILAQTASIAITAQEANLAKNAEELGGESSAFFEKSSRSQFGREDATPAGQSDERTVLSWPAMGVELRSSSDACGGTDLPMALRNTKTSGPSAQAIEQGAVETAAPNGTERFCSPTGDVEVTDSTGRTLFAECVVANDELRCLGVRSEP